MEKSWRARDKNVILSDFRISKGEGDGERRVRSGRRRGGTGKREGGREGFTRPPRQYAAPTGFEFTTPGGVKM